MSVNDDFDDLTPEDAAELDRRIERAESGKPGLTLAQLDEHLERKFGLAAPHA